MFVLKINGIEGSVPKSILNAGLTEGVLYFSVSKAV